MGSAQARKNRTFVLLYLLRSLVFLGCRPGADVGVLVADFAGALGFPVVSAPCL